MTIALIVFFTLPTAIALGEFKREWEEGQLDMLSTLPSVCILHSAVAWCGVAAVGVAVLALLGLLFFHTILVKSNILIPILGLVLMSFSLGKLCFYFCCILLLFPELQLLLTHV